MAAVRSILRSKVRKADTEMAAADWLCIQTEREDILLKQDRWATQLRLGMLAAVRTILSTHTSIIQWSVVVVVLVAAAAAAYSRLRDTRQKSLRFMSCVVVSDRH